MHNIHDPQVLPMRDGVSPSCVAVPAGPWATMLDFLAERLPAVSRSDWVRRMLAGDVVDEYGRSLGVADPLRHGLRVYYYRQLDDEPDMPFAERIVFRDEHLLVVDKPHFMPVTPSGRYLHGSLLVRLKKQLGIDTLSPVHRIDRETAGLVLFAVGRSARGPYQAMFRERLVVKHYEAIARWMPQLDFPIRRQSRIEESPQFFRCHEVAGAPNSDSLISVLEVRGDLARYRLSPVTGKRHQLRLHMNALGMPIWFDHFYPEVNDPPEGDYSEPLKLLAKELEFRDPITGLERHFESGLALSWPEPPVSKL